MLHIDPEDPVRLTDGHLGPESSDIEQRLNPMIAITTNAVEIGDGDYVVIDGCELPPSMPLCRRLASLNPVDAMPRDVEITPDSPLRSGHDTTTSEQGELVRSWIRWEGSTTQGEVLDR
jgi:hypothetical protein